MGSADTQCMADPISIGERDFSNSDITEIIQDIISQAKLRRVNIWGGPGSGKSTSASQVFFEMKKRGYSIEYIQEYIKAWAYEKRQLSGFDQLYIFAKQQRLEERVLKAGVDLIVTDSPLLMQCVYARKYGFMGWQELLSIGKMFNAIHPSVNFLLSRSHAYQEEGRWQNAEQALELDAEIESFMTQYEIPFERIVNSDEISLRVVDIMKGQQ